MGSIAMDKAGNIALGLQRVQQLAASGDSLHGPRAQRSARHDGNGNSIIGRARSQTGGLTRWGDYAV